MSNAVDSFGVTHVGMVRSENEDNFLIAKLGWSLDCTFAGEGLSFKSSELSPKKGLLIAVADGMGGHAAGKRASQLALSAIAKFLVNELNRTHAIGANATDIGEVLKRSVYIAHESLKSDADKSNERAEMGTTLTMVLVMWPKAFLVHIGDSRCYIYRQGELKQLTRDHTVRQLRGDLAAGTATREQSMLFENVNWMDVRSDEALWNVIAANADTITPELTQFIMREGDSLLVCSDGLVKHLAERQIADLLEIRLSAEESCFKLVEEANNKGGVDNITLAVARFPSESRGLRDLCRGEEQVGGRISDSDTMDFPDVTEEFTQPGDTASTAEFPVSRPGN